MAAALRVQIGLLFLAYGFVPASVCLPASGCRTGEKIPFRHYMREKHQLSADELKRIQFFLSETITLQREVASGDHEIKRGALKTRAGKLMEEIVIEKGTPGIAVKVGPNGLAVSFQEGTYLTFVCSEEMRIIKAGKYTLAARDWKNRAGIVDFDGRLYEAVGKSANACLLIEKESLSEVKQEKRTLRGRRLDE
jgi:hypothetical protein